MNSSLSSQAGPAVEPQAPAANTVLVVDDSAMDRHLAGAIVQKMAGWQATFACHGVEALAMLAEPGGLVLLGVALHEALTNAILHGNLELSSALRESDEKEYYRLSVERRSQEPYRDRRVYVTARFSRSELSFIVRDEGNGFD